jgi:ferrous iron transport protein A
MHRRSNDRALGHSHPQSQPGNSTMPLSMAAPSEKVRISAMHGGRGLRKRLADLGLNIGTIVEVVRSDGSGPLILAVKGDSRLALGRGMAHRIEVETFR